MDSWTLHVLVECHGEGQQGTIIHCLFHYKRLHRRWRGAGSRLKAKKRRWFFSQPVAQLWMSLQQEAVDAKK